MSQQPNKAANENQQLHGVGTQWVNGKYTLIHQLYEGVNSKIYVGAFMKNNRQVTRAIKIEPIHPSSKRSIPNKLVNMGIKNEINVLRHLFVNEYNKLELKVGFPHMFEFGSERQFNYIVMGMYGPNLSQLLRLCGGKFSARTTLLVALQIVDRLQEIHQKKYLYGGICPQNFLIGLNKESYLIYMTDFGKSTIYKSKNKGIHIPYQSTNNYEHISFDHVFMSVNCQLGVQASRRDDIESFMYLILYLFKGRLPWIYGEHGTYGISNPNMLNDDQSTPESKKQPILSSLNANGNNGLLLEQRSKILEIKRRISAESLFKSLSFELIDLMHYVKTLSFYEKPDYNYIRKKLWSALMETDYDQLKNNVVIYDWNQREPLDYQIYRDSPKFKLKADKDKEHDEAIDEEIESEKISEVLTREEFGEKKSSPKLSGKVEGQKLSSASNKQLGTDCKQKAKAKNRHSLQQNQQYLAGKGENDNVVENEDDANVVDEEDDMKLSSESTAKKVDEKLKIVNQIDEDQLNTSLSKQNRNIKSITNGQSRFREVNQ